MLWRAGLDVTAFDYRPELLRGCGRFPATPHFKALLSHDPRRLPYDDSSFDAVLVRRA